MYGIAIAIPYGAAVMSAVMLRLQQQKYQVVIIIVKK
jgi:hypothetical protein